MNETSVSASILGSIVDRVPAILREADAWFGSVYRSSLCMQLVQSSVTFSSKTLKRLLKNSVLWVVLFGVIFKALVSIKKWLFIFAYNIYRGSVFMDVIGHSIENSRWLKSRS